MGKIIKLEGRVLVPTQYNINIEEPSIQDAFWSCYNNEYKRIPIFPVRENPKNDQELLVLDGHRRATILDLFQIESLSLYLAESCDDEIAIEDLPKNIFQEKKEKILYGSFGMNIMISERFNEVLQKIESSFLPKTFTKMRQQCPELKNIKTAKKYFESLQKN